MTISINSEQGSASTGDGRRFHLLEVLGSGAFGEVYLAEQESSGGFRRRVALKLLHDSVATSKDASRRMRDEARVLGLLSHRHIVAVLDLVRLGDRWGIVMDHVPGADLAHVVEALQRDEAQVPPPAALEIGVAILRALDAAHHADDGQGGTLAVVHRDIKPSNVRLTADADVKVLDFGVARFTLDTREVETRNAGWIGTERYMSPERILCEGDTAAGDVYAAGATVVELLLGEPLGRTPVLEERHTPFVEAALERTAALLGAPEALTEETLEALRGLLKTEPHDRPTARDAADALELLARRLPGEPLVPFARRIVPQIEAELVSARAAAQGVLIEGPSSNTTFVGSDPPPEPPPPTLPPPPEAPPRRLWLVTAAALVASLVGVGLVTAAALLYLSNQPQLPEALEIPQPAAAATPAPTTPGEAEPEGTEAEGAEPADVEPEVAEAEGTDDQEATEDTATTAGEAGAAPEPQPPAEPVRSPAPQSTPSTAAAPDPSPRRARKDDDEDEERIKKAQFTLKEASFLQVSCGDVSISGTSSLRITDFPAGTCEIEAIWLGRSYRARIQLDRPQNVRCRVDAGALQCS